MDVPALDVPYGPHQVQSVGTVSIPKELRAAVGAEPGTSIHWILNPDIPGTLVLVPSKRMAQIQPQLVERLRRTRRRS